MLKKLGLIVLFSVVTGIVAAAVLFVLSSSTNIKPGANVLSYSDFIAAVNEGCVKQVEIGNDNQVSGTLCSGKQFLTYRANDPHMVDDLIKHKIGINVRPTSYFTPEWLLTIFISVWIPILMQTFVLIFCFNRTKHDKLEKATKENS